MKRLHVVLASNGVASRRKSEELISKGLVLVNGKRAVLGQKVSGGEVIEVGGKKIIFDPDSRQDKRILIYNKPVGEICSHSDKFHEKNIYENLPKLTVGKWMSVGRLDINTGGLLLITNDGELAHQLMHPKANIEREYLVRVQGELTKKEVTDILSGIEFDAEKYKAKSLKLHKRTISNIWYKIVLTSGKNREVRKLFEYGGTKVNRLTRIRYGNINLPKDLDVGKWKELSAKTFQV